MAQKPYTLKRFYFNIDATPKGSLFVELSDNSLNRIRERVMSDILAYNDGRFTVADCTESHAIYRNEFVIETADIDEGQNLSAPPGCTCCSSGCSSPGLEIKKPTEAQLDQMYGSLEEEKLLEEKQLFEGKLLNKKQLAEDARESLMKTPVNVRWADLDRSPKGQVQSPIEPKEFKRKKLLGDSGKMPVLKTPEQFKIVVSNMKKDYEARVAKWEKDGILKIETSKSETDKSDTGKSDTLKPAFSFKIPAIPNQKKSEISKMENEKTGNSGTSNSGTSSSGQPSWKELPKPVFKYHVNKNVNKNVDNNVKPSDIAPLPMKRKSLSPRPESMFNSQKMHESNVVKG